MRLATIFLIASMLQVSAASMAQQVTLKKSEITLRQLFKEVRKQTGYSVIWGSEEFNANDKMAVDFEQSSLQEVFNKVVFGKGYSYMIDEKTIIIQRKNNKVVEFAEQAKALIDVKGKVVDQNGAPLSGASIVLKSSGKGTSTSVDGTFTMRGIEEGIILVIKFIGFEAKEIKAAKDLGTIRMAPATSDLDEVKIQAYTQTSKRYSLSNTTSVKAKDIENQIISNPILALQGRVPGLEITQLSGNSGSSVNVRIQGNSSLRAASTPFYVVDGVPYASTTLPLTGNRNLWGAPEGAPSLSGIANSLMGEGSGSPLNYLNPNDIESIDVLKDADATAIYGSRAANGAIIITTKKGKPGATKIDFNLQSGWSTVPFGAKFLNTPQYLEIRREAYRNANQVFAADAYDINGTWDQSRSTDWQKELLRTSSYSTPNLSVTGGSINTNYRIGLTGKRERSPYGADFKNDMIAISTALNTASVNQKFKMGLVANYYVGTNTLPNINNIGNFSFLTGLVPDAPSLYNSDGSINWAPDAQGNSTFYINPIATNLTNPFQSKTSNLTSNLNLNLNLLKDLDFKTNLGYTRMDQREFTANLGASYPPESQIYVSRMGAFTYINTNNYIVEPQLTYNRQISAHKINLLVGGTYNSSLSESSGFAGYGQSSDVLVGNLAAAATFTANGTNFREYKYIAGFSRIDYRFKDRYLFAINGRRDGSSRFGPANRFANFWSIAAGWILSEEPWIKNNVKWLNFLKVRSSYGLTGNDGIGDYSFMDLYNASAVGVPYQNIVGFSSRSLFNPNLQWEEKRSFNVGLDASAFDERVTLAINYNLNRSSNLLQSYSLPATAGFANIALNLDALVQNTGWEFIIGVDCFKSDNIRWKLNGNLTMPRNKLLALPNRDLIPGASTAGYIIGQPLATNTPFNYLGVNPLTGLEVNEDINGNPVISTNIAQLKTTIFDRSSRYRAGLQSDLVYKGFSLNLSFDYVDQKQLRYLFSSDRPGSSMLNQPEVTYLLNRWKNPGDVAVIQKYSISNSSGLLTSNTLANYEDASYLRLNNVAVNWNIPATWLKHVGLKSAGIGVNAQNVFILSKYSGPNPITGPTSLPLMRTVVGSLRLSF